jgi:hypothetical protein
MKQMPWHHRTALMLLGLVFAAPAFAGPDREGLESDAKEKAPVHADIPSAIEEIVRALPPSLTYGFDGIEFIALEDLARKQAGYRGEGWGEHWYVVARRSAHGDPIFVDVSSPGLPVMTAIHGMGEWTPVVVAPAWHDFIRAVERVRAFSIGREHLAALEENPPSDEERQALHDDLVRILGAPLPPMWEIMTMPVDD